MKSTYRCPGCERTFECRPDQLARLLERGQTACKFCGGELEFPEGLREALASAEPLAGVAWDPSEEVSYACEGCQKIFKVPLERAAFLCGRATPCQLCGGALSWRCGTWSGAGSGFGASTSGVQRETHNQQRRTTLRARDPH